MNQKKIAQELKRRHKARRMVNLTGGALQALNPAFRKVIKSLDKVDKKVRKEAEDLNYLIGMARSFARRRDYLTAATYLSKFHEKARSIHYQLNGYMSSISPKNRRFLLQQFRGRDKEKLFGYDPSKKLEEIEKKIEPPKAYEANDGINFVDDKLVSTAAGELRKIKDWWKVPGRFSDLAHNLTDRKSRSMKALERSFSDPFFDQLKSDTKDMLETSEQFYEQLLENFSNMGSAWSRRNAGEYNKEILDINSNYEPFHKQYLKYHNDNIVPMKEEQAKLDEEQKIQDEANRAKMAPEAQPTLEAPALPMSGMVASDPFSAGDMSPAPGESAPGESLPAAPGLDIADSRPPGTQRSRVEGGPDTEHDQDLSARIKMKYGPPSSEEAFPLVVRKGPDIHQDIGPATRKLPPHPSPPSTESPTPRRELLPSTRPRPPQTGRYPFFTSGKPGNRIENIPSIHNFLGTPTLRGINPLEKDDAPQTLRSNELSEALSKLHPSHKAKAHEDFLDRIEKLSSEEEIIREILSYSEEVEKYSEEDSLKLLSVAEGLIEKKAAGFLDGIKKSIRGGKPKEESKAKEEAPKRVHKKKPAPVIEEPKDESEPIVIEDPVPTSRMTGPLTTRTPAPEGIELETSPDSLPPQSEQGSIEHDIPEGLDIRVHWPTIPSLKSLGLDGIKLGPGATVSIINGIMAYANHHEEFKKKIHQMGESPKEGEKLFKNSIIQKDLVRLSAINGTILSNLRMGDKHSPEDRDLQVYSGFDISRVIPSVPKGSVYLTYIIGCRLPVDGKSVIINNVKKIKLESK